MEIDVKRFGLAVGLAGGVFYTGCILVMAFAGEESLSLFLNSIIHGLDISTILRPQVGFFESVFGLINTMALGWIFGALIGASYNFSARLGIFRNHHKNAT